jgi:hypothetical protein
MNEINKPGAVPVAKKFEAMGFGILATGGTAVLLEAEGVKVTKVLKIHEGRPHIGDLLRSGEVQLMFVTAGYVLNPLALRLLSSRRHLSRAPTAPHVSDTIPTATGDHGSRLLLRTLIPPGGDDVQERPVGASGRA